jgi:hypothetical protein
MKNSSIKSNPQSNPQSNSKFLSILEKSINLILIILTILFAILLTSFSIIIIYINVKKDEVSTKAIKFIEQKLENKVKITSIDFKIQGFDLFLEIPKIQLKTTNFNAEITDLKTKINYLKILLAKFEPQIELEEASINILIQSSSPNQSPNLELKTLSYARLLKILAHEIKLNLSTTQNTETFKITNANITLQGESFEQVSLHLNTSFYLEQKEGRAFSNLECDIYFGNNSCSLQVANLSNHSLTKAQNLLPNSNFKYLNGNLKSLESNFTFTNELKYLILNADVEDVKLQIPYLKINEPIFLNYGVFNLNYKEKRLESIFKVISNQKNAFGHLTQQDNSFNIDLITEGLYIEDIDKYWPKAYLKDLAEWLTNSIKDAYVPKIFFHISTPIKSINDLIVDINFENATLQYSNFLPKVQNASGKVLVNNSPNVLIEINSGFAKNLKILPKTKAIVNNKKDELMLEIHSSGEMKDFINFFIKPSNLEDILNQEIQGEAKAKTKIIIPLLEKVNQLYNQISFKGNIEVKNLKTPILESKETTFDFEKQPNQDAQISTREGYYANFNGGCKSRINLFKFFFPINLQTGEVSFEKILIEGEKEGEKEYQKVQILGDLKLGESSCQANFSKIILCQKLDFSFNINPSAKLIDLKGKKMDLNFIQSLPLYNFIKKFETNNREDTNFIPENNINIQLESINLPNNFEVKNIDFLYNFEDVTFSLKSSIASGFKNNKELSITIPNLGELYSGFSHKNTLKNGYFTLSGKIRNDTIKGKFSLKNYKLQVNSIDLSSKEMKGKFNIDKENIKIQDMQIKNPKNTLTISGIIKKNNLALNLEVFYTPSTLDVNSLLELVPGGFASEAFNYITLGTLKKGLFTIIYGVEGSLNAPIVVFKGGKTSKGLLLTGGIALGVVTGFNPILLPVLGILAIF